MAFAMAVNNLLEAMKKPGCPICRMARQGAQRALESFLWENVNEPDVRKGILDAYGFCPTHTRVMVARELVTSSLPLGTNIIYEHLGRVVAGELKKLRPGGPSAAASQAAGTARDLLRRAGLKGSGGGPLEPRGECPACAQGSSAARNSLHALVEEAQKDGDVRTAYLQCDRLCLPHLREAIGLHSARFPTAIQFLIDDTVDRLVSQSAHMKEYIRKSNWTYRDEKLTEEEDTAWRKTLAFFTGMPGESFTHKTGED